MIVAESEGIAVGFAKLIEFQVGGEGFGCILWIAVHPGFRRRGFAGALTNEGIKRREKNGARAVFASTQRRNAAALRVLVRSGFRRMSFQQLWRLFGWRVFEFYSDIWLASGEVVLMQSSPTTNFLP